MTEQLPRYAVPTIFKMRDRIVAGLQSYLHITVIREDLLRLAGDMQRLLPDSVESPVLVDSCQIALGKTFSPEELRNFAWRIAGNYAQLRRGNPVRVWQAPGMAEWVPVQILRIDPAPSLTDHKRQLTLRVLAGSPSGMRMNKTFKEDVLWAASRELGFSRRRGKRPCENLLDLVGLRFMAKLDPERTRGNAPDFHEMRCPSGLQDYNLQIINFRARVDVECPRKFQHACHTCRVGYRECLGGVHLETYRVGLCIQCGETTWIDPEIGSDTCVRCDETNKRKVPK